MENLAIVSFVAVAVAALLAATYAERARAAFWIKASASLGFVLLGLLSGNRGETFDSFIWIGLLFAAAGDVALAVPGARAFTVGVAAFALGHLAYVAASLAHVGLGDVPAYALAVCIPSVSFYAWLFPRLGKMRVLVGIYVVIISAMVVAALTLHHLEPERAARFAMGAVLFYVSDILVALDRFVRPRFANRAFGLPLYYAGQVLIALSAATL